MWLLEIHDHIHKHHHTHTHTHTHTHHTHAITHAHRSLTRRCTRGGPTSSSGTNRRHPNTTRWRLSPLFLSCCHRVSLFKLPSPRNIPAWLSTLPLVPILNSFSSSLRNLSFLPQGSDPSGADGFEIKREGDVNTMARIYFYPDYVVPQYKLAPDLAAVLGIHTGGWGEWGGGRRCFDGGWRPCGCQIVPSCVLCFCVGFGAWPNELTVHSVV